MRRLMVLFALLLAVLVAGSLWYALVEGFPALDAVYQATTTISTVGFQEVHPLDRSGRIFTIGYIFVGVGLLFYTATTAIESIVFGQLAEELGLRRSSRKVRKMERHFVICGYGRVGREVASELDKRHEAYVIIDRDEAAVSALPRGVPLVHGDATEEATLREAGVERARSLIAAADSDVGNTYIVLTARALNPQLLIVARAGSEAAERRMITAGADRVISPYRIGGQRLAWSAVQPMLMDFMDTLAGHQGGANGHVLAEIVVSDEAAGLAGRTIADAFPSAGGLHVMARERAVGGNLEVGPRATQTIEAGDRLVIYGERDAIAQLSAVVAGSHQRPAPR